MLKLLLIFCYRETIKLFLTKEIIKYPTPHHATFESLSSVQQPPTSPTWPKVFHTRIIQHNIRVAALYYDRIHGKRLAQLLDLSPGTLEEEISKMVSDGTVYAKIDRPKDIIRFKSFKNPEEILSDWGSDIKTLLNLVDSTTHLIHKENMTQ